jgi:alkanesulfonate monooxygenase
MPVEFIGMIFTQNQSEARPSDGPVIDPGFTARFALAHEAAGFDRVLIGYGTFFPDGFIVATWALAATERLGVLLAHRPGFVAPTVAARKFATLDQFSGGRLGLHTITGGSDEEQARDGDYLNKQDRYRRTDEYLHLLHLSWTSREPFDFDGEFYKVTGATSIVRPFQDPHPPIFFGGSSDEAVEVAAKHADVYAQWGEPLAETSAQIKRVKEAAASYGRAPGVSLSLRPILAATDDEAWERAYAILDRIQNSGGANRRPARTGPPQNTGSIRLLEAAKRGDVLDRCLFMPLATATGAAGNSTALVGSVETVAQAMLDYYDVGVTTFLIRGYDPFEDVKGYGELATRVREIVAERDQQLVATTPAGLT